MRGARQGRCRCGWMLVAALGAVLMLPATPALAAGDVDDDEVSVTVTVPDSAAPEEPSSGDITNAEFRWGLNSESGSGAFAGGCNFLSAGKAGDAGGVKVWTEADGLYSASSGATKIVKANSSGGWSQATFASKCLDRNGNPVSASSLTNHTESQAVISGGFGSVSGAGTQIRWTGAFTVVMYGGMTYWTASDPVLTMDAAGNGEVTATLSGYATDRDDMGTWAPIPPREAVIAEIRGATLTGKGFARAPEYVGVTSSVAGQAARSLENSTYWGAFPASFMQFQALTGQSGYWMTTNGQRDRAKVPTTLYVSYDASAPVAVQPGPAPSAGTGAALSNPVSQRTLTPRGDVVQAASAAASMPLPVTEAATVMRDDGSSLVPQASSGVPAIAVPAAVTILSLLVGALSAMHLGGVPILPWMRRI